MGVDAASPVSGCRKPQIEKWLLFLECQFGLKMSREDTFFYIKMNMNIMRREQNSHEFLSINGRQSSETFQLTEGGFWRCPLTSQGPVFALLCPQVNFGGRV